LSVSSLPILQAREMGAYKFLRVHLALHCITRNYNTGNIQIHLYHSSLSHFTRTEKGIFTFLFSIGMCY